MKRIVFSAFGSLGDIYPYIAVGRQLQSRNFDVTIATSSEHRELIEGHGVKWVHVGPDITRYLEKDPDLMRKVMDRDKGSEFVLRDIVMPSVRESYDNLYPATEGIDLLVTHTIAYAGILVARKRNLPWISTVLSPVNLWSKYDPPAMPKATWLPAMHSVLGPGASGVIMNMMKNNIHSWGDPYRKLQADLGLEVDTRNIFFEGQFSPRKHLNLFSPVFGPPQQDWPPNTVATGFPFLDSDVLDEAVRDKVRAFLADGPPPVVFTLGSSAVFDAGQFYKHSVEALQRLNMRGVLLTGKVTHNSPLVVPTIKADDMELPPSVIAVEYLPHGLIFRHASIIVHQGGVGTTAQALASGYPQLVMPYSHDQFDNAARVTRLGCGFSIDRAKYNPNSAAEALFKLTDNKYRAAASQVAAKIQAEDGAAKAADEIAAFIAG